MIRYLGSPAILCLATLLTGCGDNSANNAPAATQGPATVDGAPVYVLVGNVIEGIESIHPGELDLEAAKQLSELVGARSLRSNDSWIFLAKQGSDEGIVECKAEFNVRPKLTEADKLNGIVWKGTVTFDPITYRVVGKNTKQWTKWRDFETYSSNPGVGLIKTDAGEWQVTGTDIDERIVLPDPSDLP